VFTKSDNVRRFAQTHIICIHTTPHTHYMVLLCTVDGTYHESFGALLADRVAVEHYVLQRLCILCMVVVYSVIRMCVVLR